MLLGGGAHRPNPLGAAVGLKQINEADERQRQGYPALKLGTRGAQQCCWHRGVPTAAEMGRRSPKRPQIPVAVGSRQGLGWEAAAGRRAGGRGHLAGLGPPGSPHAAISSTGAFYSCPRRRHQPQNPPSAVPGTPITPGHPKGGGPYKLGLLETRSPWQIPMAESPGGAGGRGQVRARLWRAALPSLY